MKSYVYFDMDGVLCDWVESFKRNCDIDLEVFQSLSKEEKFKIKETLFGYEFFRTMKPIEKGLDLFRTTKTGTDNIFILSAVGDSSHVEEIKRAKTEWIREHICKEIEILFVDKVENKYTKMVPSGDDVIHVLVDDREKAIDSWNAHGGFGVLFY